MKLNLIGHNSEYNLSLVAGLFFDSSEEVLITSVVDHSNNTLFSHTIIEFENKTYSSEFSMPCPDDESETAVKRLANVVCGMSLFLCSKKIRNKTLPWGTITGIRPAKTVRQMMFDGKSEKEISAYFKTCFAASEKKTELAISVAKNELEIINSNSPDEIGLYLGIPFCPTRCLYCSFVSTDLAHSKKYVADYVSLLQKEIKYASELTKKNNLKIGSVYIGGGTPTSLSASDLELILLALCESFDLSFSKEFCIEAGRPDTITKEKLLVLKKYGVDRISINPQTMHKKTLELIGRSHSPEDIKSAFTLARECGFENINADVIAALPGETLEDFAYTLNEIEKFSPENITVHTMSIKRGSALHQRLENYNLTSRDTAEQMLDYSQEFMKKTNRVPYYMYRQKNMMGNLENVGYSKPGYFNRYNINIMEEVQSILALGAGGSGKAVARNSERLERVFNFKAPYEYITRFDEILKKKDEFFEILNMLNK